MQCPVCDADNLDDAVECSSCGRMFGSGQGAGEEDGPLEGLETTHFAPTGLARPESLPGVERTQIEADPQAASEWTAGEMGLESTPNEPPPRPPPPPAPGGKNRRGRGADQPRAHAGVGRERQLPLVRR